MGVALAAIADDGDLLPLDQVQVGVAIDLPRSIESWPIMSRNKYLEGRRTATYGSVFIIIN
jgi:hypothetical protein